MIHFTDEEEDMKSRQLLEEVRARQIAQFEGRPQPPPPRLKMTKHARQRAKERGFTFEMVRKIRQQGNLRVLRDGRCRYTLGLGERTAFIIVGRNETVITVHWDTAVCVKNLML